MADAASVEAKLKELMAVTLVQRAKGTYDTATSQVTPGEATRTTFYAMQTAVAMAEKEGRPQKVGDIKLMMSANSAVVPQPSDVIEVGGLAYSIITISPFAPAGETIYYDVWIRK